MLTIRDNRRLMHRRDLLSIGSLGVGGLSLSTLLRLSAVAGNSRSPLTGKSVIFLFQQGGPSQLETFDPKPEASSSNRTVGGTIQTSLPGVRFGATMRRLSQLAHKFTVVRSFQTNNAGHNIQPIVGNDSQNAHIGTHFARVAGTTRPQTGMPTNTILFPSAVDATVPKPQARGNLSSTGAYGAAYAPFVPGGGGKLQENMTLNLSRDRFLVDRKQLLTALDRLHRGITIGNRLDAIDVIQQQAYDILLGGGVSQALDWTQESPSVIERYDTQRFVENERWNTVSRGRKGYYNAQAATIGRLLLLARRLCEAGCGFVTIHAGYSGVWDMHADGNNLNMADGMRAVGRPFDHAVSTFIEDVEARGLQDDILLVCCGEMGRTPRINQRGGRNHWSRLAPLLLYGAGVGAGNVVGASDRHGGEPITDAQTANHL
ncbi:MAG: DUF1501 domain-containing protein, partial [Planctomycetaceae bacterium]